MAAPATTHNRQGMSNGMLGLILFVASEIMFFGGLFSAYFVARADAPEWPPESLLSADQVAAGVHLELEVWLPAILTILLVASSVTMQMAVWQAQRGNQRGIVGFLFLTVVLGAAFLVGQVYDYSQLPFRADDTVFGTTFYTLTGFHGAHVLGGVIFITVCLVRSLNGQFGARNHEAIEGASYYWHFVDVVWLALFTTLYIVG